MVLSSDATSTPFKPPPTRPPSSLLWPVSEVGFKMVCQLTFAAATCLVLIGRLFDLFSPSFLVPLFYAAYWTMATEDSFFQRWLRTLPRDLKGIALLVRIKLIMRRKFRENRPIGDFFRDEVVERWPNKECIVEVESGRRLTFRQFNDHANRYANFFRREGCAKGDTVALFLENGIEFFALWLGLSRLGVISAWINSNLKLEPLAHSLNISKCRAVVTSRALLPALHNAIGQGLLDANLKIYLIPDGASPPPQKNGFHLKNLVKLEESKLDDSSEPPKVEGLNFQSVLCYIYTSGTTGVPKAAVIKHFRYFMIFTGVGNAFGVRSEDRVYICMPMYHTAGGILGAGQLMRGCTICIRKKFSASNFWRDCVAHDCTVGQYIGEICRYLLVQKQCPEEAQHRIRLMYGNGLRPQIWAEFIERFRIQKIGELYGSTEGNSTLMNIDNHQGSCGFMPILTNVPILSRIYPIRLLKVDPCTGEFVRDANGFCIQCRPGDTGEIVGAIRPNDPILHFEGYLTREDTQKKIIRDATRPGDTVFTSGDILHWDPLGYLYFRDRRGETYRWRGENVSTTEVEGLLQPLQCIADATVFGVGVPQREGRAGMIGLALKEGTDLDAFLEAVSTRLRESLPGYAIPIFLRVCDEVEKTGTFKMKKSALQQDGYCLQRSSGDPVFVWNAARPGYVPLTAEGQRALDAGQYPGI